MFKKTQTGVMHLFVFLTLIGKCISVNRVKGITFVFFPIDVHNFHTLT